MSRWGDLIPHDDEAGTSCLCSCNDQTRGAQTVTLFSADLLSKWGFNDGADPDEWWDYCEAHGADPSDLDFPLIEVVQRYLIPRLNQAVTVAVIETSHNPIRVETIEGRDVTEAWHSSRAEAPALTPEYVDVPLADALTIAQEAAAKA
jgi:hypothetical protein